jgi:hypothetical protein
MKATAHLLMTIGCSLAAFAVVRATDQTQSEPLQAFCVTSSRAAKPGDSISIGCVLSNASPIPFVLSSDGRWLGFAWTSGVRTGRTTVRMPFRGGVGKRYVILRSGEAIRQTQTFWIPRDLGAGPLQVRTSFNSKDNNEHFNYQCWTGTVTTAVIEITIKDKD